MEGKAQLVGIHERVRSDIEGRQPPTSAVSSTAQGGKRVATAANPNAEDAAELLRLVLLAFLNRNNDIKILNWFYKNNGLNPRSHT